MRSLAAPRWNRGSPACAIPRRSVAQIASALEMRAERLQRLAAKLRKLLAENS
jgi:hypothetical protein